MYVQVGILALVGDHSTVPLTQISCNTVFSKSQNARKAGTLCIGLNYNHNWVEIFLKTLLRSQWVFIFWSSNIHNWVEIFMKIKYIHNWIEIFLKTLPITIFEELMIQWSSNSWRKFISFYSFMRIPEFHKNSVVNWFLKRILIKILEVFCRHPILEDFGNHLNCWILMLAFRILIKIPGEFHAFWDPKLVSVELGCTISIALQLWIYESHFL